MTTSIFSPKWESVRLDDEELFDFENGLWKGKGSDLIRCRVLRNTNFEDDGTIDFSDVADLDVDARHIPKRKLNPGDILIERSGGGPNQPVGRVVHFDKESPDNFSFSNFTSRLRVKNPKEISSKFLLYALLHFHKAGGTLALQHNTTGIRNLKFEEYKAIQVPKPSIQEQNRIADDLGLILERTTKQKQILARLNELKAATMAKLFREGLKGERLKQTEIGEIPESWNIIEIMRLGNIITGTTPSTENPQYYGGNAPFIAPGDIGNGRIIRQTQKYLTDDGVSVSRPLPPRAILVVCIGSTIGKIGMTSMQRSCTNQQINAIVCAPQFHPEFVSYCMEWNSQRIRNMSSPSPVPILTKGAFGKVLVAVPSDVEEQKEIAQILVLLDDVKENTIRREKLIEQAFNFTLYSLMTGQAQ